uniref:Uncharacterized protein n=1 Tax=Anguilla anguilla TaxID=7936 RepID=A0A0E9Q3I4_ANGAN
MVLLQYMKGDAPWHIDSCSVRIKTRQTQVRVYVSY